MAALLNKGNVPLIDEKEQKQKDRIESLYGLLYRKYEGNIEKVSKRAKVPVATLIYKFRGGRREFLNAKGKLSKEEEKLVLQLLKEKKEFTPTKYTARTVLTRF